MATGFRKLRDALKNIDGWSQVICLTLFVQEVKTSRQTYQWHYNF